MTAAFWWALLGALGLGAIGASVAFAIVESRGGGSSEEAADEAAADGEPYGPPADLAPGVPADPDAQEVEALSRMLASEDNKSEGARTVIAWMAVQAARSRHISVYWLLTRGDGYGPQVRAGKVYYAATSKTATDDDRQMAADVLGGRAVPSLAIVQAGPGGWVERWQLGAQTGKKLTKAEQDARLLEKQAAWGEGVYARLAGTQWYLFSRSRPQLDAQQAAVSNQARKVLAAAKKAGTDQAGPQAQLDQARAALAEVAPATLDAVPQIPATQDAG